VVTTHPTEHDTDVTLRDGSKVDLRPLTPEDKDALADFLAGLSLRSRAFRFFSAGVDPRIAARRAVEMQYPESFGLVAVQDGRIVAHAMYARSRSDAVEVAFAVADELQGHGLGTILLDHISQIAAANGFPTLLAEVLPENHRMLEVFSESGVPVYARAEPGVVHVQLPSGIPLSPGRGQHGWSTAPPELPSPVETLEVHDEPHPRSRL
jgi:GNAT superfamily N-acetyltransferase